MGSLVFLHSHISFRWQASLIMYREAKMLAIRSFGFMAIINFFLFFICLAVYDIEDAVKKIETDLILTKITVFDEKGF